jgi:hypothetical protein
MAQTLDSDRKNLFKKKNYSKDKIKGLEEDIKLLKTGKLKPYQIEIVQTVDQDLQNQIEDQYFNKNP